METLRKAESTVENYPDSARLIIDSINPEKLTSKEKAHYTILDVQTRHKLFMPLPESDSLITVSERYFSSHGPDSLHVKALFYRAVIATEAGKTEDAARDAIEAWEKAKELNNDYWQAKAAELVGAQANEMHNYKEELKWRRLAADSYKKAGKELSSIYNIIDIASAYLNLHDFVNALRIEDSIATVIHTYPEERYLQEHFAYHSLFIANASGAIQKADSLYNFVKGTPFQILNGNEADLVKAGILLSNGHNLECKNMLDTLNIENGSNDQFLYVDLYYRLGKSLSDISMVTWAADSLLSLQFALISSALDQPVTSSQRDFFQNLSSKKEEEKKHKESLIRWIIVLSTVSIFTVVAIYRIHLKRKEKEIRNKVAEIYSVSEEIQEMTERNRNINKQLNKVKKELEEQVEEVRKRHEMGEITIKEQKAELRRRANEINQINSILLTKNGLINEIYTEQWALINKLCSEFEDDDKLSKSKWANICKELSKLRSEAFYDEIEHKLDLCTDGLLTSLKSQCPKLSATDIRLAVYLISGFSVAAIHYMIQVPTSTVYSRRKSLINKIVKAEPRDLEMFLAAIKKG